MSNETLQTESPKDNKLSGESLVLYNTLKGYLSNTFVELNKAIGKKISDVTKKTDLIPDDLEAKLNTIHTNIGHIPSDLETTLNTIRDNIGRIPNDLETTLNIIHDNVGNIPNDLGKKLETIASNTTQVGGEVPDTTPPIFDDNFL